MGGASIGFAKEGFECTGIDIRYVGYPYTFIYYDFLKLKGSDYQGYDVIWGSPPCRDFSILGRVVGHTWKRKPDPNYGLKFVNAYIQFVKEARPKIWIMENVDRLREFYKEKPLVERCKIKGQKRHAFWGNFPMFSIPQEPKHKTLGQFDKDAEPLQSWINAKIPLSCSLAFAQACKEQLTKENI
jgi:hypothetical protein